jgi:hypothetical protein
MFKDSVRTSKRTPHFTITKINWLMMFKDKEIIAVYSKNHLKLKIQRYILLIQLGHVITISLYVGILWWFKHNTYIETVNTTALLLSRHVSVLIEPSSGDVHISKL